MGFLSKLFRRKTVEQEQQEYEWDEIVFTREGVDFSDSGQRRTYIENCLEQMSEASKEINTLGGEYNLVTSYLTDMEEIEALTEEDREEINRLAKQLTALDAQMQGYRERKNRMKDTEYYKMRGQEDEIEDGIKKIKQNEDYGILVKRDLKKLNGERHAYEYRRAELYSMLGNFRGMAVIFVTALALCILMLLILQFALEMNTFVGYFIAVAAAAIALTVLCVKYMDADRELMRVEKDINKLIRLQNKVKIRYVNNCHLLDYLYMKYGTDSGDKLEKLWEVYLQEKEHRKQFAEAEAKTEYYQKQLVSQLSGFRVKDPARWIYQTAALLDPREMVEIRHELIIRRQALRKQLDYNHDVEETARREIMDLANKYPNYAGEILTMLERFDEF